MQSPAAIPLRFSKRLFALLGTAHLAALLAILLLQLPELLIALLVAAVAISAAMSLWRVWNPRIVMVHLGANGELEVESKVGVRETAIVLPQSTVLPGLIVLLLRIGGRGEHLILLSDAMEVAAHRRMRQWLRWQMQATLG